MVLHSVWISLMKQDAGNPQGAAACSVTLILTVFLKSSFAMGLGTVEMAQMKPTVVS